MSCTAEKFVDNGPIQKEFEPSVSSVASAKGMEGSLAENRDQLRKEEFSELTRDPESSNDGSEDKDMVSNIKKTVL